MSSQDNPDTEGTCKPNTKLKLLPIHKKILTDDLALLKKVELTPDSSWSKLASQIWTLITRFNVIASFNNQEIVYPIQVVDAQDVRLSLSKQIKLTWTHVTEMLNNIECETLEKAKTTLYDLEALALEYNNYTKQLELSSFDDLHAVEEDTFGNTILSYEEVLPHINLFPQLDSREVIDLTDVHRDSLKAYALAFVRTLANEAISLTSVNKAFVELFDTYNTIAQFNGCCVLPCIRVGRSAHMPERIQIAKCSESIIRAADLFVADPVKPTMMTLQATLWTAQAELLNLNCHEFNKPRLCTEDLRYGKPGQKQLGLAQRMPPPIYIPDYQRPRP